MFNTGVFLRLHELSEKLLRQKRQQLYPSIHCCQAMPPRLLQPIPLVKVVKDFVIRRYRCRCRLPIHGS